MNRYTSLLTSAAVAAAFMVLPAVATADTVGPINFESPTYTVGNINAQDGWLKTGTYDANVTATGIPAGFGSQSLQISDAVTSGSFGDQTFAKPLINAAGEADSTDGIFSPGTLQSHFEAQFDLASVLPTLQTGMHVSVSPDRGDGSRMSYLRFEDQADGIHVFFDDVTDPGPTGTVATFNESDIATLTRTPHTIKFVMDFVNGPHNDVVKIYIDSTLIKTGTSWEDYYRYDPEASAEQSPRIVKTVEFRESGTANPADAGKGFLIDNLSLESGPVVVVPAVVTDPATGVTTSDATLNGTNGPLAASQESFWVSQSSPIDTSSPNIPAGVYSTPVLPGVAANTAFSDPLSLVTTNGIITGGVPGNMPAITPGTTYYYVAWSNVDGTWYPGGQLSVTTSAAPNVTVTIDKFIDGHMATAASASSSAFPMSATWSATNIGSGSGSYALSTTGFNSPNAYEAVTADMTSGASYTTNEVTGGAVVGGDCSTGQPYALVGYSSGPDLTTAEASTKSLTPPNFANLTQNEVVIVWNKECLPAPTLLAPTNGTITTTAGLTGTSWNSVTDPAGGITYVYQSSNSSTQNPDGSFTTPAYTSGPLSATNIPTPGTPAGVYYWHVQATDADGNVSPWSTVWTFTVNNTTSPLPPANACSLTTAPLGYTLRNGTAGNDTVTLAPFTMFVGKGGNDKVTAPDGNYIICTGAGNDTITIGNGNYTIDAGAGNNTVTTGNGAGPITTGAGNDAITTGNGAHTINAGAGNNTVTTGDGAQNVTTLGGNDKITTGGGNDVINAGDGNNTVKSGAGDDVITAGSGNDIIDGGPGADTCHAGGGTNTVTNCEL